MVIFWSMKEELCAMYNPAAFQRITGIQRELVESTEKGSESPFFFTKGGKALSNIFICLTR